MPRFAFGLLTACLVVACTPSDGPVEPAGRPTGEGSPPPASTPPASEPPRRVATLSLIRNSPFTDIVGTKTRLHFEARDSSGQRVGSTGVVVTSSDTSVAVVRSIHEVSVTESAGRRWDDAVAEISLVGPGTTVLRGALNGKESSLVVRVYGLAGPATHVAIERFELIEHRAICNGGCRYMVYTPVVEIRSAAGSGAVTAVALEVTIPGASSGLCTGVFPTNPGESRHLIGVDAYLWNNDIQFVRLDGTPAPDGLATVRVIVRRGTDTYEQLSATTTIRRLVDAPVFPSPRTDTEYWTC